MMKYKLLTMLLLLCCLHGFAQKEYRVFDWKTEQTVNSYLLQQMHSQYDERRVVFENALRSKDSLLAYIENVKKKFRALLGDLPPMSPPNAKVVATVAARQYRIEKLIFESFAGHHVTANLYIPKESRLCDYKAPFPTVLFFCGHEDEGKATISYQHLGGLFATNGYVVLVVDPISQSERHQLTDRAGKPLTRGGTTEHTLINASSNLVGTSAAAYELWDNKRALDFLYTRAEVDTSRIAVAGNSGGAMQAIYFAAFEPRVKAIAVASYLASRERTFDLTGAPDGCALIPGEGQALLEMSDYLIAAAPKPIMVLANRFDFIDYNATLQSYKDLQRVYALFGDSSKLNLTTFNEGHGINQKQSSIGYWLKQWFQPKSKCYPATLNDQVEVMSDSSLFSTTSGQLNSSFKNEVTVFDRNLALADSLEESRRKFMQGNREEVQERLRSFLNIDLAFKGGNVNVRGSSMQRNGITYNKVPISLWGEAPMSTLHINPAGLKKRCVIWIHSGGKQVIADSVELIRSYINKNAGVIIADLRGFGEMQDAPAFNDPKYYNKEYRTAMLALHNGRSLVAQRATDVLDLLEAEFTAGVPVEIHAEGPAALAVLHALALYKNENITRIRLYNCITSFKDILKDPIKKDWYSWVVPNALKYYDIPDLVKLIGTDKVEFVK